MFLYKVRDKQRKCATDDTYLSTLSQFITGIEWNYYLSYILEILAF